MQIKYSLITVSQSNHIIIDIVLLSEFRSGHRDPVKNLRLYKKTRRTAKLTTN